MKRKYKHKTKVGVKPKCLGVEIRYYSYTRALAKIMKQTFIVISNIFLLIPFLGFPQLSVEEHLGMENLNNPKVFESKILFAKTTKDRWDGKSFSSITITDLNGENQMKLTESEYDYDPKWSKDGKWISFISYRNNLQQIYICLLYTSPSPRDQRGSRMPSSA